MDPEEFSTEAKTNMRSRSQRRDNLLRLITKNGLATSKDHILGIFMMKEHVSLSTTYQYLQELKMAQLVTENDKQLMTMAQYQEEQDEGIERLKKIVEDEHLVNIKQEESDDSK